MCVIHFGKVESDGPLKGFSLLLVVDLWGVPILWGVGATAEILGLRVHKVFDDEVVPTHPT